MTRPVRMCRAVREIFVAAREFCEEAGLPTPKLIPGGKHLILIVLIDGKERRTAVPCSPKCAVSARRNKLRDLRKMLEDAVEGGDG